MSQTRQLRCIDCGYSGPFDEVSREGRTASACPECDGHMEVRVGSAREELRPDILAMYTEEAEGFLREAWLQESVLVLEDQSGGKVCQRALLGGGPDEYTAVAKDLEAGRGWEKVMDRTQAAEMIAGWTVVERRRNEAPPTRLED